MDDSDKTLTFTADAGERLDKLVSTHAGDRLTRVQAQTLIREGAVTVNGEQVKGGAKLKGGEQVIVTLPPPPVVDHTVVAEAIPLHVLYEDEHIAVIDKPAGLIVHPGVGDERGTLVHALLHRYPEIGAMPYSPQRRGIIHRLDKDTSGVIVVGRRAAALQHVMRQFQARTVEKVYLALVERAPRTPTGRIDMPIARDPHNRRKMATQRGGRSAISEFSVIERFNDGRALLRVLLLTGRTHQIRVHLAAIECPIVGDPLYGQRKQKMLRRQFLHAQRLCFDHPTTGERMCFEAPLPAELTSLLDLLRQGR